MPPVGKYKICTKCGEMKEISEFHNSKLGKGGLESQCKACKQEYQNDRRKMKKLGLKPIYYEGIKWCVDCCVFKPVEEFYRSSAYVDGYSNRCKACDSARQKLRYESLDPIPLTEGTRVCNLCGEEKDVNLFNNSKFVLSGKSARCKDCENALARERHEGRYFPRRTEGTKICGWCEQEKHVDEFGTNSIHTDGLTSQCKACMQAVDNERRTEGVKVCSVCWKEKSVDEFYSKRRASDGLKSACKACTKIANEESRQRGIEKRNGYVKNEGTKFCTRCKKEKDIKKFSKRSVETDGRNYWCKSCVSEYKRKKKSEDIQHALALLLRNRILRALSSGYKGGSAVRDLQCTMEEFVEHLEVQFYPHPETGEMMTWENRGQHGWHIDHIKRLIDFDLTDREQFLEACHYTNLRPLWAEDNLSRRRKASVKEEAA